jgi:hypothetical protein
VLEWLSNTAYATGVRESLWGWPLALTIHAFGTAVVIGIMFIIFLRLFGLFRTIPYTAINKLIPIIWIAVVFQVGSGFTLWMTKPAQYLADGMFEAKITFVIAGVIVTTYFHKMMNQEVAGWDATGTVSARGLKYVTATALVWAAVLVAGRLTAYLGSLYMS